MPRVTITVPERTAQPYRFQMDRTVVTLGRGSENDIAIDSGSVSVRHAEMHRIPGGYELRDIGSTNGIKLDGTRYETIPLRDGISASIGDVTFDFTLTPEEQDTLAAERRASGASDAAEPASSGAPKAPAPKRQVVVASSSGGGGMASAIVFLILAALAFFAGMFLRHQNDTGRSLIQDIQAKKPASTAPAQPAE